jgi:hypothetical protein
LNGSSPQIKWVSFSIFLAFANLVRKPIDALEREKFREMIDIASRAKDGVRIPGRKSTREEIIDLFKRRMEQLKAKLNVRAFYNHHPCKFMELQGPTVAGEIQLTDDAWTASNGDGYFGVSGHWIEEVAPGVWESREALIGFVRLNNAHNGVRLGQALYKIVARLGIQKRVCLKLISVASLTIKSGRLYNNRQRRQQWYSGGRIRCSVAQA